MGLNGLVPAGVVTGDNLMKLMDYCKKNGHAIPGKTLICTSSIYPGMAWAGLYSSQFKACEVHNVNLSFLFSIIYFTLMSTIPAFNCTSTSTINAVLQAARDINSPVIIQVKNDPQE